MVLNARQEKTDRTLPYRTLSRDALQFPSGSVIDSEEPDFLIESEGTILGVELTELYRKAPEVGRPMQAWEKLAEQVVERACSLHSARGGPVLTVRVEFNLGSRFTKPRKEEVASKLADLVLATDIQVGDLVKLENDYDDLERFPEELTRVRVQRSAFRSRALGPRLARSSYLDWKLDCCKTE
jgi:hypothetical protein